MTTDSVKGRLLSNQGSHFVYEYACSACGRNYKSVAPEESAPALCRGCFHGGHERKGRPPGFGANERVELRRKKRARHREDQ